MLDIIRNFIFWRVLPGTSAYVKWPSGKIIIVDDEHPDWDWSLGAKYQEVYSSDPNEHYRDWMQDNVGMQGTDWDWRSSTFGIEIKFRKSKASYASIVSLKWG